eukprot:TRINITY_DN11636_c0_g1_i1.p1 TRINITY_DN11636_c0_g1~~TRINITY_DN11636_c0_g1_i1.p1  ORF type:complete len:193 (+),score=47.88 TRINITY_DN11636_c0_g1_i1:31-609(+)
MGKDLPRTHKHGGRKFVKSTDPYHKLLVQLYTFLSRRTDSPFNETILKRLITSRTNRQPVSLSKIAKHNNGEENTIYVAVTTVVNDPRLTDVPKMTVCALRVTESARQRILKAGGRVMTLDQLAVERPTGSNTVLLRGKLNAREATKHFRGIHGNAARPYVAKGARKDKFERSRGRRKSTAFKRTKAPVHGY